MQRFVEKVLGATVEGYISEMAASGTVQEFLGRYNDARRELADRVRAELEAWDVVSVSTVLGNFEAADPRLNEELQAAANEEARGKVLELKKKNAEIEAEIAETLMKSKLMEDAPQLWAQVEALGAGTVARLRLVEAIAQIDVPQFINSGANLKDVLPLHFLRDLLNSDRLDRPPLDPGQGPAIGGT